MPEAWTIRRLITWAAEYLEGHGVESPRLSAELMLARALGRDRLGLYLNLDQPLTPDELAEFKALLLRRKAHEPMAYILGSREFHGLDFKVGPGVLIPRPETEHLVEEALAALEEVEEPQVLDLCTGSGCVALALAHARPDARVTAVDSSREALAYARANAQALELGERVEMLEGSLYGPLAAAGGFFELITANPPYVTEDQWPGLEEQVKAYEPREALVAEAGGLAVIAEIIQGSRSFLRPGAWLMVELGAGQDQAAQGLARRAGIFESVEVAPDLAGVPRVLKCQRGDYG